jgi:hypothetical protein
VPSKLKKKKKKMKEQATSHFSDKGVVVRMGEEFSQLTKTNNPGPGRSLSSRALA